jgi:hypothetical protein
MSEAHVQAALRRYTPCSGAFQRAYRVVLGT